MSETPEVRPFLKGFLSQWHPARFTVEGRDYVNAEQFMMHAKARLFGDEAMAEKIMAASAPHDHKRMGQQVGGFDQDVWDAQKMAIVYQGNLAKFSQSAGLRKKLLATGDSVLAEANPRDIIWGVGLAEDDPQIHDPKLWRGENRLGRILMEVRSHLGSKDG